MKKLHKLASALAPEGSNKYQDAAGTIRWEGARELYNKLKKNESLRGKPLPVSGEGLVELS